MTMTDLPEPDILDPLDDQPAQGILDPLPPGEPDERDVLDAAPDDFDHLHGVSEEDSPESDHADLVTDISNASDDDEAGADHRPVLGAVPTKIRPGVCGTPRGYSRHLYAREKPCEDCRRANSEAQSRRRETNPDIRRKALIESRATHRALAALRDAHREHYDELLAVARAESEDEQRRSDKRTADRARRAAAKARKLEAAAESGPTEGSAA